MGEKKQAAALAAIDAITSRIRVVRGQKVMLDMDLAALYGVTTKRLNEQIRRNLDRFPFDFVFQATVQEVASLRSQFATSSSGLPQCAWGDRRYAPYAFTERRELGTEPEVFPRFKLMPMPIPMPAPPAPALAFQSVSQ